ncbi:hypothetical protein BC938DRAFT_477012 [Jimgerdemannia flammicorona]|uniref:Uncharacterized protein n=1 Tax=Jimgerdemannia flammicorona TaxID=994334 RepID=A0A433QPW0_9FUNG|nr:hypothetical protein BC938DRAFT_477012 [Jimgerdemannia flammicorona]
MKIDPSHRLRTVSSKSCSAFGMTLVSRHRKLGHDSHALSTRRNDKRASDSTLVSKVSNSGNMFGDWELQNGILFNTLSPPRLRGTSHHVTHKRHGSTSARIRRHPHTPSSLPSSTSCSLEYLSRLRQEAFCELERHTQAYNEQLVARMRFVESLSPEEQKVWFAKLARAERYAGEDTDPEVDELVRAMTDGVGVTDYSPVVEWETRQNSDTAPSNILDDQWEFGYGDLW